MREFHAIVRPLGDACWGESAFGAWSGAPAERVEVWSILPDSPSLESQSFALSYEGFAEKLSSVPRLYQEPDGSFVWVSSEDPTHRVSGQITDDGKRVLYLELRGRCSWDELTRILRMLDWPKEQLAYQLLPEAVLVRESQFRELVCSVE